jgi:hypothetical protein
VRVELGSADQAHLARDFKDAVRLPPAAFARAVHRRAACRPVPGRSTRNAMATVAAAVIASGCGARAGTALAMPRHHLGGSHGWRHLAEAFPLDDDDDTDHHVDADDDELR